MKRKPRLTQKEKKAIFGTPAAYYSSKCHKTAVQLNNELNEIADSIRKKTKDPEFSGAVDKHFWDLYGEES